MQGILAVYRVRSDARSIEDRARAIAVEQSVEMPVSAIDDQFVLSEIVGRVQTIEEIQVGLFEVRIALSLASVGRDAGQLMNVLFGNTSLHEDVILHDIELSSELVDLFQGPRHGLDGLRSRVGAGHRALTCSTLKPQGLTPVRLAELAGRFALGGIDYIKDDHSLADQPYAPFAHRVEAVTAALKKSRPAGQASTHYVPSLSGDLDCMRDQLAIAANAGIDTVLIAPVLAGYSNFHRLVKENPSFAFVAHPTMAGAARVAPPLLFGKLLRVFGADAVVFPNYGGRFGYSVETCKELASTALKDDWGLRACVPVPAGGMTPQRVPELLDFYGKSVMLLIGGGLLVARDRLVQETAAFVTAVREFHRGRDDD